ncbi:hypothetical protein BESB_036510 [Besnoitia besnoiti]|uniref:P-type ATPase A domain-containing protein n=1 Tax=Besnoitia besnoiti TaxID=94643 RepID=A0A2A9MMY8_BESBE|nr:hypothetical protein BESB_036510 [Besnoitia besnoiti]PFH37193.1 hypothetical protein BESB_036510 [Besnoitia besnoiti]
MWLKRAHGSSTARLFFTLALSVVTLFALVLNDGHRRPHRQETSCHHPACSVAEGASSFSLFAHATRDGTSSRAVDRPSVPREAVGRVHTGTAGPSGSTADFQAAAVRRREGAKDDRKFVHDDSNDPNGRGPPYSTGKARPGGSRGSFRTRGQGNQTPAATLFGFLNTECPATPLTTPIPPQFVSFVFLAYGALTVMTLLWLVRRAARRMHVQKKQARVVEDMFRLGKGLPEPTPSASEAGGSTAKAKGRQYGDMYVTPLMFVRGMLIQQEGSYQSVPGSILKYLLMLSFAVACGLPLVGVNVSVIRDPHRALISYFIPRTFYDAQDPGLPPFFAHLPPYLTETSPVYSPHGHSTNGSRPSEGMSAQSAAQYWMSNVECMQTRERICVALMLFCFFYLACAFALWKRYLRDVDLVPAPLSSCSKLRLRCTHLPHHRVEQLRRLRQREQREKSKVESAGDLRRRRFTALAASATSALSAQGPVEGSHALDGLRPEERQGQETLGARAVAVREDCKQKLEPEKSKSEHGVMFLTEEDLTQWAVGEEVLKALENHTVVDVRHTVGVHNPRRFVEIDGMHLVYAPAEGFFVLSAILQERQGIADASRLAKAMVRGIEANDSAAERVHDVLRAFHTVLLRPEEVADRQAIGTNRIALPVTSVGKILWASLTGSAFYFAMLVVIWYYCFTRNFLVLAILLAFVVSEGTYRIRLLLRQQAGLLHLAAEREKAVAEQPASVLRLYQVPYRATAQNALEVLESDPSPSPLVAVWTRVPATDIVPSDIIRLSRGDTVPCDMLLVNGTVAVDESSLRGDGAPLRKRPFRLSVAKRREAADGKEAQDADWLKEPELTESFVYAGTRVVSCTEARGQTRTLDEAAVQCTLTAGGERGLERAAETQLSTAQALMDSGASGQGGICWGVALRTGINTTAGQQLRQLNLPNQEMFRYDRQLAFVLVGVLLLWIGIVAVHAYYTRSLLLSFRFSVDTLLKLLPLWLPAICGLFATLAARRLRACSAEEASRFSRRFLQKRTEEFRVRAYLSASVPEDPSDYSARAKLLQSPDPSKPDASARELCCCPPARGSRTWSPSSSPPRPFSVVCPAPGRLPLAAQVRVVCFDKTGTLTRDDFSFIGCQPVEGAALKPFVRYDPEAFGGSVHAAGTGLDPTTLSGAKARGALFLADSVPVRLFESLVCCHGLALSRKAELQGTPLERQMFNSTGWTIGWADDATRSEGAQNEMAVGVGRLVFFLPPGAQESDDEDRQLARRDKFVLLQRFLFDPVRQVMSVVVARMKDGKGEHNEGEVMVFCKGSFEAVSALCRPQTVPSDFLHRAGVYAKGGVYVLATASKSLGVHARLDQWKDLDRAAVESELCLEGLVLFRNELRLDAFDAVEQLKDAGIRPIIITGDSALTAVAVARRVGMIQSLEDIFSSNSERLEQRSRADRFTAPSPVVFGDIVEEASTRASAEEVLADEQRFVAGRGGGSDAHDLCRRVKWINVDTGEEVERWKVFFSDEYSELALTARAMEALMDTPDVLMMGYSGTKDLASEKETDHVRGDNGKSPSLGENGFPSPPHSMYTIPRSLFPSGNSALPREDGPPQPVVVKVERARSLEETSGELSRRQQRVRTLFDRVLFRVRVFARMSPHKKALVVEQYQDRDLVVAMVGDGTNDCFAIRQAEIGVAFGPGNLCQSVAPFAILTNQRQDYSPSPSKPPASAKQLKADTEASAIPQRHLFESCGVLGVITLIREGRATLVTSFAVYKLQILYGVLSAISHLLLTVGAYGTPNAFASFFSSVAMLLGLSLAMLWSVPSDGPLTKRRPTSNPLGARTVAGVTSIVIVDILALFLLFGLLYGPAERPLPCAWVQREVRNELLQRQQIEHLLDLHSLSMTAAGDNTAQGGVEQEKQWKEEIRENGSREKAASHGVTQGASASGRVSERGRHPSRVGEEKAVNGNAQGRQQSAVSHVSHPSSLSATRTQNGESSGEANNGWVSHISGEKMPGEGLTHPAKNTASMVQVRGQESTSHLVASFLEVSDWGEVTSSSHRRPRLSSGRVVRRRHSPKLKSAPGSLWWTDRPRSVALLDEISHEDVGNLNFPVPKSKEQSRLEMSATALLQINGSMDRLVGHSLRPGAAMEDPPCSRDGRTEAFIIFVWLGACLLNAALIFSRRGSFRKVLCANPVLLPLCFILAVFLIFLVTAPKNSVSCLFMVNCPANEVYMQQLGANAIGAAKQVVTDTDEKDMYRGLAEKAEAEVMKVRGNLAAQTAAVTAPSRPQQPVSRSASGMNRETDGHDRIATRRAEADGAAEGFYRDIADDGANAKVQAWENLKDEGAKLGKSVEDEMHAGRHEKEYNPKQGATGSVLSAWYGQVLLYILCLMSLLNGLIHAYVIEDQLGLDVFAGCRRRACPSWHKGEAMLV